MAVKEATKLTNAQVKRFKSILELKLVELRENLASAKAAKALSIGEQETDLEDMVGQSHEEWIFLNRNNIDVKFLREIDAALQRIEHDCYGTCMECEEPVSIKRLEAIAWARYCVPCQEELSALEDDDRETAKSSSRA